MLDNAMLKGVVKMLTPTARREAVAHRGRQPVACSALGGDCTSVLGPPALMAYRDDPTHAGAWTSFSAR